MNTIGTKIAFYRKAKNMTQENLAEVMRVSPQAVPKWENDIACPDIQLLPQLAKIFDTTIDNLLSQDTLNAVQILPQGEKLDIGELTLKIIIDTNEGDRVRVNLPMVLVKIAMNIGLKVPQITNNEQLKNIDFEQIISMVESGVIGKLIEIDTSDGDHINIVVE